MDFLTIIGSMMSRAIIKKKEGFQGQKAIVIPRNILSGRCAKNEIIGTLYITDIGYYPKAKFHYRQRSHGADQHILIYCHDGSGQVTIGKTHHIIEPGDFFIIPNKMPHAYSADEYNPWTIYWIHFKGSISNAIISVIVKQYGGFKGFIQQDGTSINLFNEMYSELERGYGSDHLLYVNMCLSHFLTTFIYNEKFATSDKLKHKDPTDSAIDFLTSKIDQVLTLEEIAASVNLSASHFSYLFKIKTGFSPIEYFNHLKVQKACQYLLFTSLSIKEISLELGVEDQYYFSRLFKKVMGASPVEYRAKRMH